MIFSCFTEKLKEKVGGLLGRGGKGGKGYVVPPPLVVPPCLSNYGGGLAPLPPSSYAYALIWKRQGTKWTSYPWLAKMGGLGPILYLLLVDGKQYQYTDSKSQFMRMLLRMCKVYMAVDSQESMYVNG